MCDYSWTSTFQNRLYGLVREQEQFLRFSVKKWLSAFSPTRICNSSVSASMTLENKTLKVDLIGGTKKQQLAAASAMVNGIQSQLAAANTLSNSGKAVDIGGQGNISSGNAAAFISPDNQRFNDTDEPIDNGSVDAEARNLEQDANGYITRLEFYCDSVCRSNAENFSTITSDDIYNGLMQARMAEMQKYSNAYTLAGLGGFGLSQAKKLVVPLVRCSYHRYKKLENVYRSYRKEQREACFSLVMAVCNPVSSAG